MSESIMLDRNPNIEVRVMQQGPKMTPEQEAAVSAIWAEESAKNNRLTDGGIVSYHSHTSYEGKLLIDCFVTSYKYFIANMKNPGLSLGIFPLAVAGITLDGKGNTLIAERSESVTQYKGFHELVPSGGIKPDKIKNNQIDYRAQIAEEFSEETGLPSSSIVGMEPLGLIFEKKSGVYVIALRIDAKDLKVLSADMKPQEYRNMRAVGLSELEKFIDSTDFVPTSKLIFNEARRYVNSA